MQFFVAVYILIFACQKEAKLISRKTEKDLLTIGCIIQSISKTHLEFYTV